MPGDFEEVSSLPPKKLSIKTWKIADKILGRARPGGVRGWTFKVLFGTHKKVPSASKVFSSHVESSTPQTDDTGRYRSCRSYPCRHKGMFNAESAQYRSNPGKMCYVYTFQITHFSLGHAICTPCRSDAFPARQNIVISGDLMCPMCGKFQGYQVNRE